MGERPQRVFDVLSHWIVIVQGVRASKHVEVAHLSIDARDVTILMVQDQS